MAQIVQLKRSALSGKVPGTGSLNLGELALNTYDGKIFFRRSGSTDTVQEVIVTNTINTGSVTLTGAITASIAATNGVVSGSSQVVGILSSLNTYTASLSTASLATTGSNTFDGDITVLGAINARQFNISIISSSVIYESGSTKFGDTIDDTHEFTGSIDVSGSIVLNGVELGGSANSGSFTGSFTGSFIGDGSGLRGVVSDDLPIDGWDYQSNSSASISDFNVTSSKYLIDFEWDAEMGTPIGHKTFISNKSGSTQVVPTDYGVKFVVGNSVVATIDSNGITSTPLPGTVTSSAQLTSSYDTRYVLSGSITQTTWDNIASKPGGIVSGSSQIINILDSLNTYTASVSTASLVSSIANLNLATSSYELKGSGIVSGSSQIVGVLSSLNLYTTSVDSKFTTLASYTASLENKNLTIQTLTASLQSQIARIEESTASLNALTSSYARTNSTNTFNGTQTISGSLYVTQDLVVLGSSSIQNVSSSTLNIGTNLITVAVNQPSVRFGGLAVIDSGSAGGSGSFLYDSVQDEFIFLHRGDGTNITSSHFVLGPETYNNLGNEIYLTNNRIPKGTGKEHLNDSNITDDGTTITLGSNTIITGTLVASGTSLVSSSAQVVGILSSLNTYTGSNDTTNTAQNSRLTSIESVTGSYETKGNGIVSGSSQILPLLPTGTVSGSSQINVMSTTNVARLATTGSNTFNGTQTISGSLNITSSLSVGNITSAPIGENTLNVFAPLNGGNGEGGQILLAASGGLYTSASMIDTYQNSFRILKGTNTGGSSAEVFKVNLDNSSTTIYGTMAPNLNGTHDLGSSSARWSTIYTSDLSLNNGIGDWTIVEGEDDLFLYNNKKGKVYKFALTEVDPSVATPKIS